jgi:uncharacterized surface protein with fasciclin (FAS1) repeats
VECAELDFRMDGEFPLDVHRDGFLGGTLPYSGELCNTNVIDTAGEDPNLSIFVNLIEAAGLESLFLCAGPFTALIPNNDAFGKVDPAVIDFLLDPANKVALEELLLYHLLPGAYFSTSLVEGPLITLQGDTVEVTLDPIKFNNAEVLEADIVACNGVIHILDAVLIGKFPETALHLGTGMHFPHTFVPFCRGTSSSHLCNVYLRW